MKIINHVSTAEQDILPFDTVIGEVYQGNGSKAFYLRTGKGFAQLSTGEFHSVETIGGSFRKVDAEVVIKGYVT